MHSDSVSSHSRQGGLYHVCMVPQCLDSVPEWSRPLSLINHLSTNLAGPLSSRTMTLVRPVTASPNIIKANGLPQRKRGELHIQLCLELRHSLISHSLSPVYSLPSVTTLIQTYPRWLDESRSIIEQYTLRSRLLKNCSWSTEHRLCSCCLCAFRKSVGRDKPSSGCGGRRWNWVCRWRWLLLYDFYLRGLWSCFLLFCFTVLFRLFFIGLWLLFAALYDNAGA